MHGHNRFKSILLHHSRGDDGYRRLNAPATASLIYTLTNVCSRAAALVFTPFFTRLMTPDEYGRYALFHTYSALLCALGTLEIGGGIMLRILRRHNDSPRATIRAAAVLSLVTLSLCALGFLLYERITGAKELFPGSSALLLASVLFSSMINLFTAYCRYFYKWRASVLITVALSIIAPALSLFVFLLPISAGLDKAAAKIAVGTAALAAVGLPALIYMLKGGKGDSGAPRGRTIISEILRLALPMLPYYLSVMLINETDKLMIAEYLGSTELAKYSVAYSAGVAASVISTGASQILCAWVVRKCSEGKYAKINEVLLSSVKILSALVIAFLCAAPEVFSLLAPREYASAAFSVYPVAIAIIPIFMISVITSVSLGSDRVLPSLISGLSAAALHAALAHRAIPSYGISSAGIVHLISYELLFVMLLLSYRIIEKKKLVNVKNTFCIMASSILLSFLCYHLRAYLILRVILALSALVYAGASLYKNRCLIEEK